MEWDTRYSKEDASVNFVAKKEDGGALEARFVQRDHTYFIAYLSSQSGCNQACRFCHLTQLRQTMMGQATLGEYHAQFARIMLHYDTMCMPVDRFNVNLMARGEPLLNPYLAEDFRSFASPIFRAAQYRGLDYRINISSIFPKEASDVDLVSSFRGYPVRFYWSLYSLDPGFRRRWLPKSDDPARTLDRLLKWQEVTGQEVAIHHALIEGENDRMCDHLAIRDFIAGSGLKARLNLVRYNSFGAKTGKEASEVAYKQALEVIGEGVKAPRSRIVPRVGRDVAASCGMFIA